MIRNIITVIMGISVATALCLTGCGGGSDGGNTAPVTSTETFQLKTAYLNTFTVPNPKLFTISGTTSGSFVSGSGTETDSTFSVTTFEGIDCYKQVTTATGTISVNGTTVPYGSTSTSYYDSYHNYLGSSGKEYTLPIGTMYLPQTAKVNDTGVALTETIYPSSSKSYSIGTYTHSFSLEPDTATTALLKLITIEKDTSNTVVSTSTSTYRLTPSGSITRLYETYVTSTDNLRIAYEI